MKLREGNVFTGVCHSVRIRVEYLWSHVPSRGRGFGYLTLPGILYPTPLDSLPPTPPEQQMRAVRILPSVC